MDYDIVLKKIVTLWRDSGATLNGEPKKVQYLTKQPRPDKAVLFLDYGVPKRLLTPEYIYEIPTIEYGKVTEFADDFPRMFNYTVVEPTEAEGESLRNIMYMYAPLVISINSLK
jgi:hypothetical protein